MSDGVNPISVAGQRWKVRVSDFAESEVFDRLFKEGMALVEEAASYLDGPGREESRDLDRNAALTYAAESMAVTTRLMQTASWLVVQRAVRENDMSVEEAGEKKFRLGEPNAKRRRDLTDQPEALKSLVERSFAIYERVWRLDEALYSEDETESEDANPVINQMNRLRNAAENGVFDPMAVWRQG